MPAVSPTSKRYEPFRSKTESDLSEAYWRDAWGDQMAGSKRCLDGLRNGSRTFARLDAAQLVKHAFALRTAVQHGSEWNGKRPILFYLYADPERWPGAKGPISYEERFQHRVDLATFSDIVAGDEVSFRSCPYSDLLASWAVQPSELIRNHAVAFRNRFLF